MDHDSGRDQQDQLSHPGLNGKTWTPRTGASHTETRLAREAGRGGLSGLPLLDRVTILIFIHINDHAACGHAPNPPTCIEVLFLNSSIQNDQISIHQGLGKGSEP
jgi:hypothetical protein